MSHVTVKAIWLATLKSRAANLLHKFYLRLAPGQPNLERLHGADALARDIVDLIIVAALGRRHAWQCYLM